MNDSPLLRSFLFQITVVAVSAGATAFGAGLALDFDELDTAGGTTVTAAGFQSFTIDTANAVVNTPVVRTYGTITVSLQPNNSAFGFDDRLRATPTNSGALTTSDLLRDFVFSRATGAGNTDGFDLTIAGLAANQPYRFTIYSFDSSSLGNRVSDWFANGVEVISNYSFNGSVLPADDTQYQFSFTASTDAAGQIVIGGRRDDASLDGASAPSFGVFLNAIQLDLVPEPATGALLTSGLGFCVWRRRR